MDAVSGGNAVCCVVFNDGTSSNRYWGMWKVVNGSFTTLIDSASCTSPTTPNFAAGDAIMIVRTAATTYHCEYDPGSTGSWTTLVNGTGGGFGCGGESVETITGMPNPGFLGVWADSFAEVGFIVNGWEGGNGTIPLGGHTCGIP